MPRAILILTLLLGLVLAGCTSLTSLGGDVTAETTETQGVIVEGVPNLIVNHFFGDVVVRPGEDGKITANLTKKSRLPNQAEAEAQLDQVVMSFSQLGTDVTLTIDGPEGRNTVTDVVNLPSADLELLIPAGTTLQVELGAGDVSVEQPTGDVTVNSGASDVTATLPVGASFRLLITGGAVNVTSDFAGVPDGGVATDIDTAVGDNPTQTLAFNLGAGTVRLIEAAK